MTTVLESATSYPAEAGMNSSPIPMIRPHRLRSIPVMRVLAREAHIDPARLIWPVFVRDDIGEPHEITAMSGQYQHTIDSLHRAAAEVAEADADAIDLFGVSTRRSAIGLQAWVEGGILDRGLAAVRAKVGSALVTCTDAYLDELTDHGYCGLLDSEGGIDNDAILSLYQTMAIPQARVGAYMVSPSGMMDDQVAAIRVALDQAGYADVAILAYSAKYASAYFRSFREAVGSTLKGGRRTYQQDPASRREGLSEALLDAAEGADMLVVKPADPCLDVLVDVAAASNIPAVVYRASGEYTMVEAAAANGQIDRTHVIDESLTSIFHAGADSVLTYWAFEAARRTR